MIHTRRSLLIGLLYCLPILSFGQFRKYSNEFLNIGAGARGLAMGGAQVSSIDDGTSGYWNPAGLTGVKDYPVVNIMHASYFSDIAKYDYASLAIPIHNNTRAIGLSVLRFGVDDIPNTLFLVEPDGSINYNNIQSFSSADYAFLLSYAQKLNRWKDKNISFGANAKVIYRKVGHFASAWGFGFDAGLRMQKKNWSVGVVAKDITTTFNAWSFTFTDREKEVLYLTNNDIPVKSTELTAPRITVGGDYNFRISKQFNLLAEADLDLTFDGKRNTVISSNGLNVDPHIGIEAAIHRVFFVRAGVTNFQRALSDKDTLNQKKVWIFQPSLGAGVKIKNINLDFAFSNLANQSNPLYTYIFSLKFDLRKRTKK
jgi:hypothetical protein